MIYSKTSEYAIRALAYMATKQKESFSTFREVARNTQVPEAYVAKIFQCLVQKGVLGSSRGRVGGFYLKEDPSKISLARVIHAIEDASCSIFSGCIMGLSECNDKKPCALHGDWVKAKERILRRLAKTSVLKISKYRRDFSSKKRRQVHSLSRSMKKIFE